MRLFTKKNISLIYRTLIVMMFSIMIGALSDLWAQPRGEYRPYDRGYERGYHDREWYDHHRRVYRRYPPPPVYAPPPVVYGPPPPPPGLSIILPPIIIR
jgi:hypothetical protein